MITADRHFKSVFGCKVYRLSVAGGITCPNRDGTCGVGGCSFCAEGSGSFTPKIGDINQELDNAKQRVIKKCTDGKFMAYFQSYTATYRNPTLIERMKTAAMREDICAISVATRPDCLDDSIIEDLKNISAIKPIYVELGLQTASDSLARRFNRGYDTAVYLDACRRLKAAGFNIITHMIIGLPNQSEQDICDTARLIAQTADGVKIQLLHVLKGTALYDLYMAGEYTPLEMEEYIRLLCRAIEQLTPDTVVHRMTGDGDKRLLAAPMWSADKKRVLNAINRQLKERGLN